MIVGINQPYYLPYIGLFDRMKACDSFIINPYAPLNRTRSNHRRVRIIQIHPDAKEDHLFLTQNVSTKYDGHSFSEVKLDERFWATQDNHVKTIYATYRSSPYYNYMKNLLDLMHDRNVDNLGTYNFRLIYFLAQKLGLSKKCVNLAEVKEFSDKGFPNVTSDSYGNKPTLVNLLICKYFKANLHLVGQNGPLWLQEEAFLSNEIKLRYQKVGFVQYRQFSRKAYFVQGLSTIDLLFNQGPNAGLVIGSDSQFIDRETLIHTTLLTGR